jgi:hypothetical protein
MRHPANARLVDLARFYLGVHEVGRNGGPIVEAFQRAVDGKASGEPWCMAFIQFLIEETEKTHGIKSPIFRSEHCQTVWYKSPKWLRAKPQPGSLMIWKHGSTLQGHVGLVTAVGMDTIFTIEGNTGPGSGVVREGDGVYERVRSFTGEGSMQVMGWLTVFASPPEAPGPG